MKMKLLATAAAALFTLTSPSYTDEPQRRNGLNPNLSNGEFNRSAQHE